MSKKTEEKKKQAFPLPSAKPVDMKGVTVGKSSEMVTTTPTVSETSRARAEAFAGSKRVVEVVAEGSSVNAMIKTMVAWSSEDFVAKILAFSLDLDKTMQTIEIIRLPNGIDPTKRLQWMLMKHDYHTKFLIKVSLTRGNSWYQYCSGKGNGTIRNKDLYTEAAVALNIAQSAATKVAGHVSPLTLVSVLAPIMARIREGLPAYCRFPNLESESIPLRYQFSGSLSAWIDPECPSEESHAADSGAIVINYGTFLQSYIASANEAKAREATPLQIETFWTKLISGCHISLFLWAYDMKTVFANNKVIAPKNGPQITGMSSVMVKSAVSHVMAGDLDAAANTISKHMVAEIGKAAAKKSEERK